MIVVLDTGGVEGVAPIDEKRRARLRVLREQATDLVLPAAVLAEGVFSGHSGYDFHVRRLLDLVTIADVDTVIGQEAGGLRRAAMHAGLVDPAPAGVDAIVVAEADARAANDDVRIITSDGSDFELLSSVAAHAGRLSVVVV